MSSPPRQDGFASHEYKASPFHRLHVASKLVEVEDREGGREPAGFQCEPASGVKSVKQEAEVGYMYAALCSRIANHPMNQSKRTQCIRLFRSGLEFCSSYSWFLFTFMQYLLCAGLLIDVFVDILSF